MNDGYTTAFKLLTLGFSVVPSGGGDDNKAPLVSWTEYQQRRPTEAELYNWNTSLRPSVWGIVTGAISGVFVVDADSEEARTILETTGLEPHVLTPRGGAHYYFAHPGQPVKTDNGILAKLDIRGDGGFVNIVGKRKDGKYRIMKLPMPDTLYTLDKLPLPIRKAIDGCHQASQRALTSPEDIPIHDGQRNSLMTSLAGAMRRRGMSTEAILSGLLVDNKERCQPPLPEGEIQKIARSVGRYAPMTSSTGDSNERLASTIHWPEPLASEAFHGLAGDVIRVIEPYTEADVAALLTNFLVAFGNCIGRGPHGRAEADTHACNLNIVQVGDTSKGRKGSAWGHVRELLSRVDPVWAKERIASGLSSGEGLIWEVRDPIEKMIKDELVVVDEGVTDKRLLVCETEFAAPLKVATREGNTLSATIRQAWDSGGLRILTKNSPARATGAHISILGHVTRNELLRYLNDTEGANGFANRFLWACVRRSKTLPEGGGCPDYKDIVAVLKVAIDRARELGELSRDATTRRLWAEIYPDLSEGRPGLLGAVTARAEAQVLRLSVIYAALDGDTKIRPAHLMAALAVWQYCEASAQYIFGDAWGDPVADRILDALRQSPAGLSRTSIYRLFSKHVPAARIEQALRLLRDAKCALCEVIDTEGRPAEVWRAA